MKRLMLLSCLLLVVSLLAGCGLKSESAFYYYSPSWVSDGRIILIGATETKDKDTFGAQIGSSYSEYVITINSTGTDESPSLFDATGAPPYSMSCSPTNDYVAYMDELRNNMFSKIIIRSTTLEAFTGLEMLELNFANKIKSFDWSSDGTKIAYCTTTEVRVRDWNDFTGATDTLITAESDLQFVSWKYGGRIAFVYSSAGTLRLGLIYPDASGRIDLAAAASVDYPQISATNTNEVYGVNGTSYGKVDVSAGTPAFTSIKASFGGSLPRLSPDSTKVTYSKTGQSTGIYLLTVATEVETQIK
ncbi:MAG: hypothetical protein KKA31_00670 [Candidatus Margulisbacteria bacterium]|nr:hypothetical protein [Candidatus Margulisiibacteriota bacterium]